MRIEDAELQKVYLSKQTKLDKVRMEEEAYDQKQKEVDEMWRKKRLDYKIERNQLIDQLTEAAIIRASRGKRKGKRGGGKKKKK